MSDGSKIEWLSRPGFKPATWNPVTGCNKVSTGCKNCYAERVAKRLAGRHGYPADKPFRVTLHSERLDEPLKWRQPRMVFVCSMGDLFHEAVPFEFIDRVVHVMFEADSHTYQVLTKRPERTEEYAWWRARRSAGLTSERVFPPNMWLGTSVENQRTADERIPLLLQTPAAVRFVSYEPALGPVELGLSLGEERYENCEGCMSTPVRGQPYCSGDHPAGGIDWVIAGGESGPGARPMHPDWARSLRDQCVSAGVPFFFKQWGEWLPGQNDPHPLQSWGLAHWQDGKWGARKLPQNPERNYVVWYKDGEVHYGNQAGCLTSDKRPSDISAYAERVGKKRAGALLDGREWRQFPEVVACRVDN